LRPFESGQRPQSGDESPHSKKGESGDESPHSKGRSLSWKHHLP
jgi:hypothetical protein